MGLLDQIVGAALGRGGAPGGAPQSDAPQTSGVSAGLLQQVIGMLGQPGALSNLTAAFQKQGMGNIVQSWIGTGQNLPVSPSQLQQVLGSGTIDNIAQKVGISGP